MPDINTINNVYTEDSLSLVLLSTLMTILLSSLLVFTYDKTTPVLGRSQSFIQSLMLMSVVTSTIMQSIGDSLALSFGIFGALAIIRFRSMISDPRDIAFIFATMAVGIACGVHSFQNAVVGTITFCIIIFILKFTPFSNAHNIKGNIRIDIGNDISKLPAIEAIIKSGARSSRLARYRVSTNPDGTEVTEYEFAFIITDIKTGTGIQDQLHQIEGVKIVRLMFEDNYNLSPNT
jgi:uncharacterized membrane protein YhiD involved in acid resistance